MYKRIYLSKDEKDTKHPIKTKKGGFLLCGGCIGASLWSVSMRGNWIAA